MEIWIKQGETAFRFPVLPPSYEITKAIENTTVNINAIGEITLLGKRKLRTIPLSSFFPEKSGNYCEYKGYPSPWECVKILESMQENGIVQLTITETQVNLSCTIENFQYGYQDGTGDIAFELELKEYIKPSLFIIHKKEIVSENIIVPDTKRENKGIGSEYMVKSGDCLTGIAKKMTGTSANWKVIYEQNKHVIGDNPNLIYPGQRLVIHV